MIEEISKKLESITQDPNLERSKAAVRDYDRALTTIRLAESRAQNSEFELSREDKEDLTTTRKTINALYPEIAQQKLRFQELETLERTRDALRTTIREIRRDRIIMTTLDYLFIFMWSTLIVRGLHLLIPRLVQLLTGGGTPARLAGTLG
ncbi:hypothetical protein ACN6A1_03280 [Myxococcus virescens]|uniref:hypothetical protein n=1 Tax=Myxococcus virescens TaxID=83456 RepID=UPI003DA2D509